MSEDRSRSEASDRATARTKPVEQRLQFDSVALERYLVAQIEGLRGPLQVEQFEGGQSNPTYRLTAPGDSRFVLRRKPPGKLLPSAHAVDRSLRFADGPDEMHRDQIARLELSELAAGKPDKAVDRGTAVRWR